MEQQEEDGDETEKNTKIEKTNRHSIGKIEFAIVLFGTKKTLKPKKKNQAAEASAAEALLLKLDYVIYYYIL